jgi:hypothetical protein
MSACRIEISQYFTMIRVRFAVVHFNNGMHGWRYSDVEYARYFHELPTPHSRRRFARETDVGVRDAGLKRATRRRNERPNRSSQRNCCAKDRPVHSRRRSIPARDRSSQSAL